MSITISLEVTTSGFSKVYVSSTATLPDIRIAAHEAVHVNDIKHTQAFINYEATVCENIPWTSKEYAYIAETINQGNYDSRYDIGDAAFGNAFVRELTAYLNEFLVTNSEFAE